MAKYISVVLIIFFANLVAVCFNYKLLFKILFEIYLFKVSVNRLVQYTSYIYQYLRSVQHCSSV